MKTNPLPPAAAGIMSNATAPVVTIEVTFDTRFTPPQLSYKTTYPLPLWTLTKLFRDLMSACQEKWELATVRMITAAQEGAPADLPNLPPAPGKPV